MYNLVMLKRFQIYLNSDLHKRLKHRAVDEGITLSELIRQLIEAQLNAPLSQPKQSLAGNTQDSTIQQERRRRPD